MITCCNPGTPDGGGISIMRQETRLACAVKPTRGTRGGQSSEAYIALDPNGTIPVLGDEEGLAGQPLVAHDGQRLDPADRGGGQVPGPRHRGAWCHAARHPPTLNACRRTRTSVCIHGHVA